MTVVIAVLIGLIVILLAVRMRQSKSQGLPSSPPPPQSFGQQMPQYRYQQPQPKYGDVPAAPDLTMLDNKWK